MSVQIQTVEFERREAYLSKLEGDAPWTVHGVALGADDVTIGQSGIKKLWPADALEKSADSLKGRNLVVDHDNESRGVVGQVTKAGYKENIGVIYEAELFDEELAEKISNGLLEVSIRGKHTDVNTMEETEDGAKIVEDITFDNLSIVPTGAAPSNTIEMGETEELSVAELSAFTDTLEAAQLAEVEPGMWVTDGDIHGITISAVEDGEVEVDVYEESDGSWRSTGEAEMVSVDSLEAWDVDEDDIEPMEDDEEPEDDESEQAEIPEKFFFESEDEAMDFIEDKDGLTGVHEMDGMYMPGADHDEFLEWWDNQSSQSGHEDEEEMQEEELQDYEMHTPDWSDTTESEWSSPDMEDFDTDDLSEIASHFLISTTGFPPENFSDLKLPVVEPNGDLNVNALSAVKGGRGVTAVDGLGSDMEERIINWVNNTANEGFDRDWGEDEEEAAHGKRSRTVDDTGDEPGVQNTGPVDVSLDLINKYLRLEGKHERDSVSDMLSWMFGATDLPMETVSDFRSASNTFLNQTAGTDAFSSLTIEQFRDWLLMHGDGSQGRREQGVQERGELPPGFATPVHVLTGDDLRQMTYKSEESELDDITTKVFNMTEEIEEKLAELNEPVAVEQGDLEELQQKADRFEEMSSTLEDLKERTDILDDVDREQVEELAEADEPVVVESTRYESLEGEAEQVKTVYAAALSEEMDAFSAEELADRFSIDELRDKYEEQIGNPAEELTGSEEADPQSGDPSEEELEEAADSDTEEASESEVKAEEMRAELRDKIINSD